MIIEQAFSIHHTIIRFYDSGSVGEPTLDGEEQKKRVLSIGWRRLLYYYNMAAGIESPA
jgi:hypothetical protein